MPADFSAIANLINKSYEVERSHIDEPLETVDSIASAMEGGIHFVSVDSQNALVGCVYVNPRLQGIFQLTVDTRNRRQGHGRKLMREAESYGKSVGWPETLISILDFRAEELVPYYRNLGYVETGESRSPSLRSPARMIRPCKLIMMSKKLA